jgi:hypothetical protein
MTTTAAEARVLLTEVLEALDDVQVWPFLTATLPHVPAVVVRRNGYPAIPYMGARAPHSSFDAICVVDMADDTRTMDMDDLVERVGDLLKDTAMVKVEQVGDEEEFLIGGQSFLGCPITVKVL